MKAFNVMEKTELENKPINVEDMAYASMNSNLLRQRYCPKSCQQTLIVQREKQSQGEEEKTVKL